mgnify:CR=1 FL=1
MDISNYHSRINDLEEENRSLRGLIREQEKQIKCDRSEKNKILKSFNSLKKSIETLNIKFNKG